MPQAQEAQLAGLAAAGVARVDLGRCSRRIRGRGGGGGAGRDPPHALRGDWSGQGGPGLRRPAGADALFLELKGRSVA